MEKSRIIRKLINCEKFCSEKSLQGTYILTIRQLICSDTANSDLADSILDNPNASRLLVARCVYRLSSVGLLINGKGMDRLLESILKAVSKDMPLKIRYIGARALVQQSKNEGCSFFMLRTSSIIQAVISLVNDNTQSIQAVGIAITKNFATFPLNHRVLCRQGELLTSLCRAFKKDRSQASAKICRDAVNTLLMIANQPNSTIAKHYHLVASIASYGLQSYDNADDQILQKQALQCVLKLMTYM